MGAQSKLLKAQQAGAIHVPQPTSMKEVFSNPGRLGAIGTMVVCGVVYIYITRKWSRKGDDKSETVITRKRDDTSSKSKVAVDYVFFRRLWALLKIIVPGPFTPESGYLTLVAAMMLARTWCDVWMLKNGTAIERTIITRNYKGFLVVFLNFVLAFFPISVVNNLLHMVSTNSPFVSEVA